MFVGYIQILQHWIFIGRTDAEAKAWIIWPPDAKSRFTGKAHSLEKPQCWEGLKAGGEGDDRGWDGWMASLTQWTWVRAKTLGDSEGLGGLACCTPGVAKSWTQLSDWTMNNNTSLYKGLEQSLGFGTWRGSWNQSPAYTEGSLYLF